MMGAMSKIEFEDLEDLLEPENARKEELLRLADEPPLTAEGTATMPGAVLLLATSQFPRLLMELAAMIPEASPEEKQKLLVAIQKLSQSIQVANAEMDARLPPTAPVDEE
jgi:hypothetical protein